MSTVFVQEGPRLSNTYASDGLLKTYLEWKLGPHLLASMERELLERGDAAVAGSRAARRPPGPGWNTLRAQQDPWSRTRQFASVYLFHPVTDIYSCPLAMTGGAARTLLESRNAQLIERAVPHLTSRDPAQFWTSGQWMTESTGGSDVGLSRTTARRDDSGVWHLHGKKWFTSAANSQMALTLARPEGNGPGGSGLALFYLEPRRPDHSLNGIRIEHLKDKLGTRKVPTAELSLDGTTAELVTGITDGTRAIEPMLKITRTWNSVCAVASMRHALTLAQDYAVRRRAFGATLAEQPLHRETLAELQAVAAGAFLLTFFLVELLGRDEAGLLDEDERALFRFLTPIVKLAAGKQAVDVVSEALEAFGGADYIEDTGIPCCCATHRCCRSGKARRTSSPWMLCFVAIPSADSRPCKGGCSRRRAAPQTECSAPLPRDDDSTGH